MLEVRDRYGEPIVMLGAWPGIDAGHRRQRSGLRRMERAHPASAERASGREPLSPQLSTGIEHGSENVTGKRGEGE